MAEFSDFLKLDIRVGTITDAKVFAKARKPAYQLEVDFGAEIGMKKSSAQITERFQDETSVRVYEAGFSEYRIVYRNNVVIPAFYETAPMPWAESYVVLE